MKKGNIAKGIILGICLCTTSITVGNYASTTSPTYASTWNINMLKNAQNEAIFTNEKLKNALCKLLGKDSKSKLYTNEFLNNQNYKPDSLGKAKRTCLDLSYSGVSDITELAQFEFPSTLVAIDLSGNGITNEDLPKLREFLNKNTTQEPIQIIEGTEEKAPVTINIKSNFDTLIEKINLNFNQIDLDAISTSTLDNNYIKFIFGIQKLKLDSTTLYQYSEVKDAKYYIRDNDLDSKKNDTSYLSFNFFYNAPQDIVDKEPYRIQYKNNQVTPLILENELGIYNFNIASIPESPTAYFTGVDIHENLSVFKIAIRPDFTVERKTYFNLKKTDIIVQGFDSIANNYELNIGRGLTATAGIHELDVKITADNKSRDIKLPYTVVDTIKPIISLEPDNTSIKYWRQYKEFVDPGYSGTDSGDSVDHLFTIDYSDLDVTKCGTYQIVYNLVDESGLAADPVIRTVVVQEQVLDEIVVNISTTDIVVGQEIVLTAQPKENIDMSKYKDLVYTWYMNGEVFKTSTGDTSTGKSSIIITPASTNTMEIHVVLTAKQQLDNKTITTNKSDIITITPELDNGNTTLIIAMVAALSIILGIVIGNAIIKYRKAKKTHKKAKAKNAPKRDENIQVIKDYNPNQSNPKQDKKDSDDKK